MTRIARIVIPGIPHHVTQRGNRRQKTFFSADDYRVYLKFLEATALAFDLDIWSYCLMPNHVHLLAVPKREESLRDGIGNTHLAFTRRINRMKGWTGHLWQGRFFSSPIDPNLAALVARYIEMNPVRANLCANPCEYPWSSAAAVCAGDRAGIVKNSPFLDRNKDWEYFLSEQLNHNEEFENIRHLVKTGRPFGDSTFIQQLERRTGRKLRAGQPGPRRGRPRKQSNSSVKSD